MIKSVYIRLTYQPHTPGTEVNTLVIGKPFEIRVADVSENGTGRTRGSHSCKHSGGVGVVEEERCVEVEGEVRERAMKKSVQVYISRRR